MPSLAASVQTISPKPTVTQGTGCSGLSTFPTLDQDTQHSRRRLNRSSAVPGSSGSCLCALPPHLSRTAICRGHPGPDTVPARHEFRSHLRSPHCLQGKASVNSFWITMTAGRFQLSGCAPKYFSTTPTSSSMLLREAAAKSRRAHSFQRDES